MFTVALNLNKPNPRCQSEAELHIGLNLDRAKSKKYRGMFEVNSPKKYEFEKKIGLNK